MTQAVIFEGQRHEFPDDFTDDEISDALASTSPARAAQPRRRPNLLDQVTGGIANLQHNMLGAADDELAGIGGGAVEGVKALFRGEDVIGSARRGYDTYARNSNDQRKQFLADRPIAGNLLLGTGASAPILMSAGATAPTAARGMLSQAAPAARGMFAQTAQGRGAGAFLAQTANAASTGSAVGATYGFLDNEGSLAERAQAGREGGLYGGLLGAASPLAINAARGVGASARFGWRMAARAADQLPEIAPAARSGAGVFGSQIFSGGPRRPPTPPPPPPLVSPGVGGKINKLANRMNMAPDDVERSFDAARANPQGQTLVDTFGDPGVRTLRAMAQAPGQTGERAARVAEQRFQEAPARIVEKLKRGLSVSESRDSALRRLSEQYEKASAELYRPIMSAKTTPEQMALYEQRIAPLMDDPVLQDAQRRATQMFTRERRLGLVEGNPQDNFARYLHYIKMGLDDAVAAAPVGSKGAQATEMRGIMELRKRFVDALDAGDGTPAIIPGYAEARARWGGLKEAEEALDTGAKFISMNGNEVSARVAEMTPFQLEHARIGFAEQISEAVGLSGRVVGNANVANSRMLNSIEGQKRIAAAFDTPEQAADFLDTVVAQNRLMRNAGQWGTSSTTFSNETHGADNAIDAVVEFGAKAITGDVGGALKGTFRQVGNLATNNAIERSNNEVGEVLLRRIDSPEAKAFTDEVVRILRERAVGRSQAAAASRAAGTAAGMGGGKAAD